MTAGSTTELIKELLTKHYDVEPAQVGPDAVFEDMALDSLALTEITLTLGKKLGVEISEGTLQPEQTLNQAVVAVDVLRRADGA